MKNANLPRYPHPSSLRRTGLYVALLGINPRFAWSPHPSGGSPEPGALHLDVFDQPARCVFSSNLLEFKQVLDFLGEHHVAGELELAAHECLDRVHLLVYDAEPRVARHGQGHGGSTCFPSATWQVPSFTFTFHEPAPSPVISNWKVALIPLAAAALKLPACRRKRLSRW